MHVISRQAKWGLVKQEMSKEQENNRLEWPDHPLCPYILCMTLAVVDTWSTPFLLNPWGQSVETQCTEYHKYDTDYQQLTSSERKPGAYRVSFSWPEEDNNHISLQTQQPDSVHSKANTVTQFANRFPPLRLEWKDV